MQHIEPEDLAVAALGEPLSAAVSAHLAGCATCTAELEALASTVALGRSARGVGPLVAPPDAVWARVKAELGLDVPLDAPLDARLDARPSPDVDVPLDAPPTTGELVALRRSRADRPRATDDAPEDRRSRRTPWLAAAAAAGLVVGAAGGTWWAGRDGDPATIVAQATLDPLPGWEATGQAYVQESADGERRLVVSLAAEVDDGGFREVWLIDRDVERLVSLGVLEGSSGEFTLPAGIDLDDFAVVDVSEESFDGDPAHSGDSIIRGVLGA